MNAKLKALVAEARINYAEDYADELKRELQPIYDEAQLWETIAENVDLGVWDADDVMGFVIRRLNEQAKEPHDE